MSSNEKVTVDKITKDTITREKAPKTTPETTPEAAPEAVEKTVKIVLPLTREETGDVFVSVNERSWLIKRGEEVEVPECVAEVIRNKERALRTAIDFISANEQKLAE